MNFIFKDDKLYIGSKVYKGEAVEGDLFDVGKNTFDGKIYHYPGGKYQICKSDKKVFRVPVPLGKKKNFSNIEYEFDDEEYRKNRIDNVLRAKKRIEQIVLCNEWQFFYTFTFDDAKVDGTDISLVLKKTQNWLKNQTKRKGFGYLLVPEFHKKEKRVHMHALGTTSLDLSDSGTFKVKGFKKPVKQETIDRYSAQDRVMYPVFNCSSWNYGFSTAIEVYGNPSRLANYVLKYITKQQDDIFGKSYWVSKNIRLYPTVELYTLPVSDYYDTKAREYWVRARNASFKYINRTGQVIEDMAEEDSSESEVLAL